MLPAYTIGPFTFLTVERKKLIKQKRRFDQPSNKFWPAVTQPTTKESTQMEGTVRCPYCVLGLEFRPMVAHVDGRYICNKCGHTTHPSEGKYECPCSKCRKLICARALLAG